MGIQNIIAIDGDSKRLTVAHEFGAELTINFKDYDSFPKMLEVIKEQTGGGLCELGFFVDNGNATINPHFDLCNKEITLVGSWVYTFRDYVSTFEFLKRAKGINLPINKLITHRFGLLELNEAMHVNMKQEGIKIVYVKN